jgi:pimeloyl-ACP methyl ester carboxylesterase
MINRQSDLRDYCAEGVRFHEDMVPVSEGVSVRVVTFEPPARSGNPAVVFVPGWITLMSAWRDVLREMTRDFTVYYLETREKISSSVSGKVAYTVEALGRDVVSYVSRLGLEEGKYVLFGSSLGATVVLDCVRFLEKKPKCLALVGPNAVFRVPAFGMAIIRLFHPPFYSVIRPFVKWYLRNFRLNVKSDAAQYRKYCDNLDAADPWKLKKAALAFSKYEVWDLLPQIRVPVLVIGASKDKLHEPENLKRMTAMLPAVSYVDLETNMGTHSPEMVFAIRKYLADIQAGTR